MRRNAIEHKQNTVDTDLLGSVSGKGYVSVMDGVKGSPEYTDLFHIIIIE